MFLLTNFLNYEPKEDKIDGGEDLSNVLKSRDIPAKNALVVMLTGLNKAVKIPLCFYFSGGSTRADELKVILNDILVKLYSVNLYVHLVICDLGTPNQSLAKKLGIDNKNSFFKLNNNNTKLGNIYFLFDTPRIYKAIRNNFMKYNVEYIFEGKEYYAKWQYICKVFGIYKDSEISPIPKINASRIRPTTFQKMKVSRAVFSL